MKTIENWSLKATYPVSTNDPLEFIAKNKPDVDFVEWFRDPATLLPYFHSFSSKVSDVAMWGRYADSARGVCLAFCFPTTECVNTEDVEHNDTLRDGIIHYNVVKGSKFFRVKYDDMRVDSCIDSKDEKERTRAFAKILSTKAKCWRDEREFRFLDDLIDADKVADGNAFYEKYMKHLCGVILGERCLYNVEYVKKLFKQYRRAKSVEEKDVFVGSVQVQSKPDMNVHPLKFDIQFVQSEVHDERFQIVNEKFSDDMTLAEFENRVVPVSSLINN